MSFLQKRIRLDILILGIVYKIVLDLSYFVILTVDIITYPPEFDIIKYINGWIWCVFLLIMIRHERKMISTFALYLIYTLQIVPITTVFSISNKDAFIYNYLCMIFFIFEIAIGWMKKRNVKLFCIKNISRYIITVFVLIILYVLIQMYKNNGLPSFDALNIWNVYKLRGSGLLKQSKYVGYMRQWMMEAIIPFLFAICITRRRYWYTIILCIIEMGIYLYTGLKGYLFGMPMTIILLFWSKRKDFYNEFVKAFFIGFSCLGLVTFIVNTESSIWNKLYSLFVRRVMMVSAVNKFSYYDYFLHHPKFGLYGMIPYALLPFKSPYEGQRIGNIIAGEYYNKPTMNSNTGFLAEGYMRFGLFGIILGFLVLLLFLQLMDKMQQRTSFQFVIGAFTYPIYLLADGHLLDQLFFGTWMIIFFILVFYRPHIGEGRIHKRKAIRQKQCLTLEE